MQWLTTKKEVDRLFKARHERWVNFSGRMSKFVKIRADYRCEYCGRAENTKAGLHVLRPYHLDGDDRNWEPENLAAVGWLCYWYFHYRFVIAPPANSIRVNKSSLPTALRTLADHHSLIKES